MRPAAPPEARRIRVRWWRPASPDRRLRSTSNGCIAARRRVRPDVPADGPPRATASCRHETSRPRSSSRRVSVARSAGLIPPPAPAAQDHMGSAGGRDAHRAAPRRRTRSPAIAARAVGSSSAVDDGVGRLDAHVPDAHVALRQLRAGRGEEPLHRARIARRDLSAALRRRARAAARRRAPPSRRDRAPRRTPRRPPPGRSARPP